MTALLLELVGRPVEAFSHVAENPARVAVVGRLGKPAAALSLVVQRLGLLVGDVDQHVDGADEQSDALHEQAERCRRLAGATYDRETSKILGDMADGFDRTAENLAARRTD